MRAVRRGKPAGLSALRLADVEARPPAEGEIRVRLHAASLNYRDGLVVGGTADAVRINQARAAGWR